MSEDFKAVYDSLRAEQNQLTEKMQAAKIDAIKYVQELVDAFGIRSNEIAFEDQVGKRVVRPRGPAAIKYRTPNGIEWSGKGNMKREVRAFLEANNMTREDLDQFLTEQFKK